MTDSLTDAAGDAIGEESAHELRRLLDRQAIVDLLLRYASTIDAKDYPTLRSLFCDDIHARYGDESRSTAATSCWRGSTG